MLFKAADLRNMPSINTMKHGGSFCINFGAPAQMHSMIIFMPVKKRIIDGVHPVEIPLKCLWKLDGALLHNNWLQSPP